MSACKPEFCQFRTTQFGVLRFLLFPLGFVICGALCYAQPSEPTPLPSASISLRGAIALSLRNNPQISNLRLESQIAAQEELDANSVLDTEVNLSASVLHDTYPSSSGLSGSSVTEKRGGGVLSLQKRLTTGTELQLGFDSARRTDDSLFTNLSPEYPSELSLYVSQPLLRGAGSGKPRLLIEAKKKLSAAARFDFLANLSTEIYKVISIYWRTKLAERELALREKSLRMAEQFKQDSQASVDVGLLTELAVSQAQANIALTKEQYLEASDKLAVVRNELKQLLFDQEELAASTDLNLVDEAHYAPFELKLAQSVELALLERPEILAQTARIEALKLDRAAAQNNALPELNLKTGLALQGLAGKPRAAFYETEDPDRFKGGYGDSLDSLGSRDFYRYELGVEMNYPLENSSARAKLNTAKIVLSQANYQLAIFKKKIIAEVQNSLNSLRIAKERIEAAKQATEAADRGLSAGIERFKAGVGTAREVLESQEDLAQAELNQVTAQTDYQLSISAASLARGQLLKDWQIELAPNN